MPETLPPPTLLNRLLRATRSTLALKIIMAVSGLLLAGFTVFHMAGHLQILLGRTVYNDYAATLQGLGPLKWVGRIGLLALLIAHVAAARVLFLRNRRARPERYAGLQRRRSSLPAVYMAELGLVLLLFIVYHLLHFTIGAVHVVFDGVDYYALHELSEQGPRRDVYAHFVISFQQPAIVVSYVLASVALTAHLAHGLGSSCKTLGLSLGRWRAPIQVLGIGLAALVGIGFVIPPLAVWAGFVGL